MLSIINSIFYNNVYHVRKLSDIKNVPFNHRKYIFAFLSRNGFTIPYIDDYTDFDIIIHEMNTPDFTKIYIYCVKRVNYMRKVILNNVD
jgi:hypothetical protein